MVKLEVLRGNKVEQQHINLPPLVSSPLGEHKEPPSCGADVQIDGIFNSHIDRPLSWG
jgi:hypothetical protein